MKLLELLCEELPKRDGWPEWAVAAVQSSNSWVIFCGKNYNVTFDGKYWNVLRRSDWGENNKYSDDFNCHTTASDHATRIVTREEYEAAVTPRVIPRRSDVLASLVGSLKQWPTEITDDLPHFIGWGWKQLGTDYVTLESDEHGIITCDNWVIAMTPLSAFVLPPQPTPHGSGDPILGMVLADLTNRALVGKKKYGEPLKAHNGRNALQDAYEEALDMCMYLRQALEEQRNE